MNSESIVVLVLTALAIGFIIFVRMNSQDHEGAAQPPYVVVESDESRDRM
jgi:hypothetical protein